MTQASGEPQLLFDTTVLSHLARADRLDVLPHLVIGRTCATTDVVRQELLRGAELYPELRQALELDWLDVLPLDTPTSLACFARWVRRMGASDRNLGEASLFAVAELCGGTVVTDDADGVRANGLDVHGTIWLLARACREGKVTEVGASNLIDNLRATGMRLPCTGAEFPQFARHHGLLP